MGRQGNQIVWLLDGPEKEDDAGGTYILVRDIWGFFVVGMRICCISAGSELMGGASE